MVIESKLLACDALATETYLLFGYVDRFVENDPDNSLPATRVCGGALVCHVLLSVWKHCTQRQMVDAYGVTCCIT